MEASIRLTWDTGEVGVLVEPPFELSDRDQASPADPDHA